MIPAAFTLFNESTMATTLLLLSLPAERSKRFFPRKFRLEAGAGFSLDMAKS